MKGRSKVVATWVVSGGLKSPTSAVFETSGRIYMLKEGRVCEQGTHEEPLG